jgi:hypothetical protein
MPRFRLKSVSTRRRLSWRILLVNGLMLAVAAFFAAGLTRELSRQRPIPAPPAAPRAAAMAEAASGESERPDIGGAQLDAYNVIVAKHLFNQSRAEGASTTPGAAAAPVQVKPALHGVVVDGAASLAYLEDPTTSRVLVYRVGDSVAGGQLVKIAADRVQIIGASGQMDVLLNDPMKPKSAAPTATAAAATAGAAPRPVASPQPAEVHETKNPARPAVAHRPVRTPRGLPGAPVAAGTTAPPEAPGQ